MEWGTGNSWRGGVPPLKDCDSTRYSWLGPLCGPRFPSPRCLLCASREAAPRTYVYIYTILIQYCGSLVTDTGFVERGFYLLFALLVMCVVQPELQVTDSNARELGNWRGSPSTSKTVGNFSFWVTCPTSLAYMVHRRWLPESTTAKERFTELARAAAVTMLRGVFSNCELVLQTCSTGPGLTTGIGGGDSAGDSICCPIHDEDVMTGE